MDTGRPIVVLISADAEWKAFQSWLKGKVYPSSQASSGQTPFGEWLVVPASAHDVIYVQGGWGKIAAASSAQYAVDRWKPALMVNLGTCGGFANDVEIGTILLVERTLVYDIVEQMGDFDQAIAHYTTQLDLSWMGDDLPAGVRRSLLVSADRDLLPQDICRLKECYGAIAGDWESGSIAWVAAHNATPCLILRGISDLVGDQGNDTYGNYAQFCERTGEIMGRLLDSLPFWLDKSKSLT